MGFEIIKENYTGSIKEVTIGTGDKALKLGGQTCLPFYTFEGDMPNKPKIAMEVWDMEPPEWPESAKEPFKDCLNDPAKWAKKCVEEYGADAIALQLRSIDPNDKNAPAEDAVATVKRVLDAVDVPVIVWGCANVEKDAEVLKKIAEECEGRNLAIGPIEDANHKQIGASVMGFNHTAIASSPIDINLAKQINILLENLGLPLDRVIIDPTTGGLGYGLEYSYSVMERILLAAMTFGDDKLQNPIINNLSFEVWKCKEAKDTVETAPLLGDPERRGILMESVTAVCYLIAGSSLLILRHPETVKLVRAYIDLMIDGGMATEIAPIEKLLPGVSVDYAEYSPEPDLKLEEEKKAAEPAAKKEEAPPKKEEKKEPEEKVEEKKEEKVEEKKEEKAEEKKEEVKKEEKAVEPKEKEPGAAPATGVAVDEEKLAEMIKQGVHEVLKELNIIKPEVDKEAEKAEKLKKIEEEKAKAEEAKKKEEEEYKKKIEQDIEAVRKKYEELKKGQKEEEKQVYPENVPTSGPERLLYELNLIHKRAA